MIKNSPFLSSPHCRQYLWGRGGWQGVAFSRVICNPTFPSRKLFPPCYYYSTFFLRTYGEGKESTVRRENNLNSIPTTNALTNIIYSFPYPSQTTGSEGVSFLFPQLLFSQQRLERKEIEHKTFLTIQKMQYFLEDTLSPYFFSCLPFPPNLLLFVPLRPGKALSIFFLFPFSLFGISNRPQFPIPAAKNAASTPERRKRNIAQFPL